MIQGNDEQQCYFLHPKLYPDKKRRRKGTTKRKVETNKEKVVQQVNNG